VVRLKIFRRDFRGDISLIILMTKILKEVRSFVEEKKLVEDGDRILIAVSGGPDSIFLLHFLIYLKKFLNISLSVAYIHHHLRKEAEEELEFVRGLCRRHGIPFYYRNIRIEGKTGIEEKARIKRYRALYEIAGRTSANKIAVGHNMDDQVETVIIRFIKGAGIAGLGGISPVKKLFPESDITVIRPLLCIEKKEIVNFLEKEGIEYRMDTSNLSTDFFRNRIRLEVLPYLLRYNPQLKKQIAQMSFLLQDDFSFLEETGKKTLERLSLKKGMVFDTAGYKELHLSLKRMVAAILIEKITGNPYRSYNKIRQLVGYLEKYPGRKTKFEKIKKVIGE